MPNSELVHYWDLLEPRAGGWLGLIYRHCNFLELEYLTISQFVSTRATDHGGEGTEYVRKSEMDYGSNLTFPSW